MGNVLPPEDEIRRKVESLRNMPQYRGWNEVDLRKKAIEVLSLKDLRKETKGKRGRPPSSLPRPQGKFIDKIGTPNINPDLCIKVGLFSIIVKNDSEKQIVENEFENIKKRIDEWEPHAATIAPYLSTLLEMDRFRNTAHLGSMEYKNLNELMMTLKKELGLDRKSALAEGEETGREIIQEAMRKASVQIERHRDAFKWLCPRCGKINLMESPHFLFSSWCGTNESPEECVKCEHREKCGKTLWNERIFRAVRDREMSIFTAADIFETSIYNILYIAQLHNYTLGESFDFRFSDIDAMRACLKRESEVWGIKNHPSLVGIE